MSWKYTQTHHVGRNRPHTANLSSTCWHLGGTQAPRDSSPTHLEAHKPLLCVHTHTHKAMDPSCNQSWTPSLPGSWPWMLSSTHAHTHADRSHGEPQTSHSPLCLSGPVASSSSCLTGRDGETSGPGYFCFDIWLLSHLFHLPASNSRDPLPRDIAGHSLMSRHDRWQQ